jgi:hypothetical protein
VSPKRAVYNSATFALGGSVCLAWLFCGLLLNLRSEHELSDFINSVVATSDSLGGGSVPCVEQIGAIMVTSLPQVPSVGPSTTSSPPHMEVRNWRERSLSVIIRTSFTGRLRFPLPLYRVTKNMRRPECTTPDFRSSAVCGVFFYLRVG